MNFFQKYFKNINFVIIKIYLFIDSDKLPMLILLLIIGLTHQTIKYFINQLFINLHYSKE